MESASETSLDWHQAKALLEWYVELGVTEAITDTPVNCYELPQDAPKMAVAAKSALGTPRDKANAASQAVPRQPAQIAPEKVSAKKQNEALVAEAKERAAGASSLSALKEALEGFDGCTLKRTARRFIFADGTAGARLMIIGEWPTTDDERAGKPMAGQAGALLDRMLAAIGRDRASDAPGTACYITTALPWQPPAGRAPSEAEIAMIAPFLERHIELAKPDVVILMGNVACQALWSRSGILRMRGTWGEAAGRPAIAMVHPGYLLKTPIAKRDAWADLLAIQAKLKEGCIDEPS